MGVISRGIKNAFRNTIRTISLSAILGLSIALALIMLLSLKTVQAKIDSVKSSIGNIVTVNPAGVRGFEGGGDLLTSSDANTIKNIANVKSLTLAFTDRLTPITDTSLASAIDPGSFGQRQQERFGPGSGSNNTGRNSQPRTFTIPINAVGTNDLSSYTLKSGAAFDPSSSDNVALLGADLATKNNLSTGGTFKAYGADIKVAGIYDTGNRFTNASIVMPLTSLQTLSGQKDQLNSITVQTSSIDSLSQVQNDIKSKIGSRADVTTTADASQNAILPLENIKTIATYSLIGSLVAGAAIILMTMMMIVRERRREIGVLKAIGASNMKVMSQFVVESLVLTLTGSILGIVLGFAFSNPVLKVLVTNSQSSSQSSQGPQGGFGGGRALASLGELVPNAQNTLRDIHAVVNFQIILYGLGAALLIAIIGSALPALMISKIRPAEVMRTE